MKYHFRGGYRLIPTDKINLLLKSDKKLNKDCFRVWFACNEQLNAPEGDEFTLKYVLQRPFSLSLDEEEKRSVAISSGRIRKAEKKLRTLGLFQPTDEKCHKTKVPKNICLAIATGQITKREALILLWYFKRRKAQQKRNLKSLQPGQFYARLPYSELSNVSGIHKQNISKTIKALERKKIICTVPQPQLSTNRFGICVVDGLLIRPNKKEESPLWPSCEFFRMTGDDYKKCLKKFSERDLTKRHLDLAIETVDLWLADDNNKQAQQQRKHPHHYQCIFWPFIIKRAQKMFDLTKPKKLNNKSQATLDSLREQYREAQLEDKATSSTASIFEDESSSTSSNDGLPKGDLSVSDVQERTKPLVTFLEKERTVVDLQERRELLKRQCEELKRQEQKDKIAATG